MNKLIRKYTKIIINILYFTVINLLPLIKYKSSHINTFFPLIELYIIYIYGLFKPFTKPLVSIIVYGYYIDCINDLNFGISTIALSIVYATIYCQRHLIITKPFKVIYTGFVVSCILFYMVKLALFYIHYKFVPALELVLIQYLITIILYPIIQYFTLMVINNNYPTN